MKIFEDAFNLLCGNKIASGATRDVFECKIREDVVVKVEHEPSNGYRSFANVAEQKFWDQHCEYYKVSDWLAPCVNLSPDGRVLLQKRVKIATESDDLPRTLPAFLTDTKIQNFGWLGRKFVCVDYAFTIANPSLRRRTIHWWDSDA